MKKILYVIFVIFILQLFACNPHFNDGATGTPPACDNTTSTINISFDWSNAQYTCTTSAYANQSPPNATGYNYGTQISLLSNGNLNTTNSYLCQIISKNDEHASDNCSPTSGPVTYTKTWDPAGPVNKITIFANRNTDVTVDYFDVCASPCNDQVPSGRPWFIGVVTLPAKVTAPQTISMVSMGTHSCQ